MTHTIGMISLGCAKNQVNAEHMLWLLRQAGYEISPDPDGASPRARKSSITSTRSP